MKRFKKVLALVLAGVLALAMLTPPAERPLIRIA